MAFEHEYFKLSEVPLPSTPVQVVAATLVALSVAKVVFDYFASRRKLSYPPGPRPLPLVGNLLDIPLPDSPREQWKIYAGAIILNINVGDIMHFRALGRSIVVLSSLQAVKDLLDLRAAIYSDRPYLRMFEISEAPDYILTIAPYGKVWRDLRQAFQSYFTPKNVSKYEDVQLGSAHELLKRLIVSDSSSWVDQVRVTLSSTILEVGYGHKVQDVNDRHMQVAGSAIGGFVEMATPGQFLIEFLPFLRYVPSWMPGANFKRQVLTWRRDLQRMFQEPFDEMKQRMVAGQQPSCLAADILKSKPNSLSPEEVEALARNVPGAAHIGGAGTSGPSTILFFLAMALHPEVQRKAQEELDRVVGSERLPTFSDRPNLPYIEALTKEVLRWELAVPLSIAHSNTEEDEYRGYRIPKGSIILVVSRRAILHDERTYPDPFAFKPERFLKDGKLNPDVLDPSEACFGFGRRRCPGRHFAANNLFSIFSNVLHTFNITPAKGKDGKPVDTTFKMSRGTISSPSVFDCDIIPRSAQAEALIRAA
ncbi:cytochrome P450 [Panus rudis PR-1116 ss-1]|nr:cytochrome P450 [Panus rudis PR-1116 ss-1]